MKGDVDYNNAHYLAQNYKEYSTIEDFKVPTLTVKDCSSIQKVFQIKSGVFFINTPDQDPDKYQFEDGQLEWDTINPWLQKNEKRNNYLKLYRNKATFEGEQYELMIWHCLRAPEAKVCQIRKKRGRKAMNKENMGRST